MTILGANLLRRLLSIVTGISAVFQTVAANSSPPPFTLSAHVEWESADKLVHKTLRPGQDALHPFDHFRLHATSDRPVYMYVLEIDSTTGPTLLYPERQHSRVPNTLVLPPNGKYRVQGRPGEYTLAIFASQQPMTQAQCEKLSLQCPLFPEPTISKSLTRGSRAETSPSTERVNDSDSTAKSDEKKSNQKESSDSSSRKEPTEPAPASGQSAKDGTRGGLLRVDSKTGVATIQSDSNGSAYITLTFQRLN